MDESPSLVESLVYFCVTTQNLGDCCCWSFIVIRFISSLIPFGDSGWLGRKSWLSCDVTLTETVNGHLYSEAFEYASHSVKPGFWHLKVLTYLLDFSINFCRSSLFLGFLMCKMGLMVMGISQSYCEGYFEKPHGKCSEPD